MKYIGKLDHNDPLFDYLRDSVYSQIVGGTPAKNFRVFQMQASNDVFLYEETHTQHKVIGKFFQRRNKSGANAWHSAYNEWQNLNYLKTIGLNSRHFRIPKAFGIVGHMNCLVIEEYCPGQSLSCVMTQSLRDNNDAILYARLTDLAWFLAKLHNYTAGYDTVNFHHHFGYFDKVMARLKRRNRIHDDQLRDVYQYRDQWQRTPAMWQDNTVLVHGDATPSNFLFGADRMIIPIDFERMHRADRAYDLGMVVGEIRHHFLRSTGHMGKSEQFISHFLWEYCTHFPDRQAAFSSITQRVPFYMGLTLFRIARNYWLDWDYSQVLVREALSVLRK